LQERPILIGVGAVIEDKEGRILLVKHRAERGGFWQGRWICPGGELELGETIEEGIKREVKEETQLDIELTEPLRVFDRVVKSGNEVSLHVIYIDYMAKLTGGELKAGSDVGEAMWIDKKRVPEIWEELHDDTRRLLQIAGIVDTSQVKRSKS
jgi:8-oxo-dGTP diphosphatase